MDQVAFPAPLTGTGVTGVNDHAVFSGSAERSCQLYVKAIRSRWNPAYSEPWQVCLCQIWTTLATTTANSVTSTIPESLFSRQRLRMETEEYSPGQATPAFPRATDLPKSLLCHQPAATWESPTRTTLMPPIPNGDALTYSLDTPRPGMFIDPVTGLLQWTVLAGQEGANTVTVRATDPDGLFDTQTFDVIVPFPNRQPTITSTPSTDGTAGVPLQL